MLPEGIERILLTEEEIAQKVNQMALKITADFQGKNPLVVGLLKGSFIFMADLVRKLPFALEVDFMSVSSYGQSMENTEVRILKDLSESVTGRDVIVVEDIIDSGITLKKISDILKGRGLNSLSIATLLSKPSRRKVEVNIDYVGFEIDDHFVAGYGLDFAQQYRALPYLAIVKPC